MLSLLLPLALATAPPPTALVSSKIDPLTAKMRLQPSRVEAGGHAEIIVDLELAPKYHAYMDKFKIVVESPDDLKLGDSKLSPVVTFADPVTKTKRQGVEGKSQLKALIEVPPGFAPGAKTLRAKLTYQACTEEHCLFPKTVTLEAPLEVFASR